MALKTNCASCNKLVDYGTTHCPECALKVAQERQEKDTRYKFYRQDIREQAFYISKEWLRVRKIALARDHFLCQHCLKDKQVTAADVVHHIKELKQFPELALTLDNLLCLCNACHNTVHNK